MIQKRTVSVIHEGDTTEIQWGDKEPVDGMIQGYALIHPNGTLTVPFHTETDEAFVFVLGPDGGAIHASEDQPPTEHTKVRMDEVV